VGEGLIVSIMLGARQERGEGGVIFAAKAASCLRAQSSGVKEGGGDGLAN